METNQRPSQRRSSTIKKPNQQIPEVKHKPRKTNIQSEKLSVTGVSKPDSAQVGPSTPTVRQVVSHCYRVKSQNCSFINFRSLSLHLWSSKNTRTSVKNELSFLKKVLQHVFTVKLRQFDRKHGVVLLLLPNIQPGGTSALNLQHRHEQAELEMWSELRLSAL